MSVYGDLSDEHFDMLYWWACGFTRTGWMRGRGFSEERFGVGRRNRFYVMLGLLGQTRGLGGMTAECGCFRGLSSYLICAVEGMGGEGHRVFDSFEGLSDVGEEDVGHVDARKGKFACGLEEVRGNLVEFPGVEYFKGWIPAGFPDDEKRYRFVHVDVDLYQPTRASLEYFWPRMVDGGVVVVDDWNWPGCRKAVEGFGVKWSETPAGTVYLVK